MLGIGLLDLPMMGLGWTAKTTRPTLARLCTNWTSGIPASYGVYQDNDPSRDMSNADIVRAIRNLEEAAQQGGPPIQGEFHTLNDWRY
jgi:hypothetical protein